MSYYEVKLDGVSIYDPAEMPLAFVSPKVVGGLSDAGSFDFTMPKKHVFYNNIVPYGSTIEVFEDGKSVFYGRPTLPKIDFYGNKQVHCEGALSFLNDVILPPVKVKEGAPITMTVYIQELFAYYNKTCKRNDRKLTLGTISLRSDQTAKHSWNYESCFDVLKSDILPYTGSYTIIRRSNGVTYIDFAYQFTSQINQPIKLSSNMLDLENVDQDFYTAIIAKGASDKVQMLTPMTASASLVQKYGFICAFKEFPTCTTMESLQSQCASFLQNQQTRGKRFKISAADLHLVNSAVDQFMVGKVAKIDSNFHTAVDDLKAVISRIEINMDTGEKNTTLLTLTSNGIIFGDPKPERIVDRLVEEKKPKEPKPGEYDDKVPIKGRDENSYIVDIDENGDVEVTKIPDELVLDNSTEYSIGDTFDPSDITATFVYGDGTEVPAENIEYNIPTGYEFTGDDSDPDWLTALITDPNIGITYTESIPINKESKAPVVSIAFSRTPDIPYSVGDTFDLSKYSVIATRADGSSFDITGSCQFSLTNGHVFTQKAPTTLTAMYKDGEKWFSAVTAIFGEDKGHGINCASAGRMIRENGSGHIINGDEIMMTYTSAIGNYNWVALIASATENAKAYRTIFDENGYHGDPFVTATCRNRYEKNGKAVYYTTSRDSSSPPIISLVPHSNIVGISDEEAAWYMVYGSNQSSQSGSGYSDDSGGSSSGGGTHF